MLGETPAAVEGKQVGQQEKGKTLFSNFPLTFFRPGAADFIFFFFFNNREQSRGDRLKYTLLFSIVLGGECEFLVAKIKCSGFESLTLPTHPQLPKS